MITRIKSRARAVLGAMALYISICGLVTFSLFIIEESIQTAMFGTWQAIDAKDWHTVKFGCDRIGNANQLLKTLNYSLGWIQPLSFFAYRAYGQATDAYLQGLEARIFANAPELFAGQRLAISFTPREIREAPEGYRHINRRIIFLSKHKHPVGSACRVTGLVSVQDNKIIVTATQ